tara:strand:+ start:278 stop:418 length:141 start_codon:yes stop_codon:yes gene_type:complete
VVKEVKVAQVILVIQDFEVHKVTQVIMALQDLEDHKVIKVQQVHKV